MENEKILIVEDEPNIRNLLKLKFEQESYTVIALEHGLKIRGEIEKFTPDLIVLDVMLPFKNGFEILKELQEDPKIASVPVLFLTAKTEEEDILKGFEFGVRDYMKKPFSPRELIARVKNILQIQNSKTPKNLLQEIRTGRIYLNSEKMKAQICEKSVKLTVSEFKILELLLGSPEHPFSREKIIAYLRGPQYSITERTIDVLVSGLRKKIATSDCKIESVRGYGYRLILE